MSIPSIPSFSLASLKNAADELRAQVYPRNETEKRVYEALSSKNWGASTTLMQDIAQDTMDYEKYQIVMPLIWNSLETDGKSWKQIFKALTLIDFLVKNGSERVIEASRDKLYKIRSLQDFNYYEQNVDKGSGVREKAKQLVDLLGDNDAIRSEREKARSLRNKFVGISNDGGRSGGGGFGGYSDSYGGDRHKSDNSGRYAGDSGGRYSDNYSSSGRYGDSGIDSDKFGSKSSNSRESGGRFGGGAYDSNRPPKFSDEEPVSSGSKYLDEDDDLEVKSKSKATPSKSKSTPSDSGAGGKLKINLKKASAAAPAPAAAPEVDFFGSDPDPFGAPAPAPAPQTQAFDPFGVTPAPAPAAQFGGFDPFAAPAPVAAPAALFDPFAPTPVAPQTQAFAPQPQAFDPFAQSAPVAPAYNAYAAAPPPVPAPMNNFGGMPMQYQQQPQFQQPVYTQPQAQPQFQTQRDDFGDFEGAKQAAAPTPAAAASGASKWGDIGKLVDLSGIGKTEEKSTKQTTSSNPTYTANSFAGLDGFQKTNPAAGQPMYGGPALQQQQQQPMMARPQPTGMGMGMGMAPQGGMGTGFGGGMNNSMMQPPAQGFGMQQPMGMGAGMGMGMGMGGGMGGTNPGMNPGMMQQPMNGGWGQPGQSNMGGYQNMQGGFGQQQQQQYRGPGGW